MQTHTWCNAQWLLQLTSGHCVVPSRSLFYRALVDAAVSTQPPAVSSSRTAPAAGSPFAKIHTFPGAASIQRAERCMVQRAGSFCLTGTRLRLHSSSRAPWRMGWGCQLTFTEAYWLPLPSLLASSLLHKSWYQGHSLINILHVNCISQSSSWGT